MSEWTPTEWQQKLLAVPEQFDLACIAGRGVGKTVAAFLLLARHAAVAGRGCRAAFLRKTRTALKDAEAIAYSVFGAADPGATYNRVDGVWTFSNGATVVLGEIDGEPAARKWTGASLSMLVCDEAQQHASPLLLDKLYASLRLAPARMIQLAHGGDVGDTWLQMRYIVGGAEAWEPFKCEATGRTVVRADGRWTDNPNLPSDYEAALLAACGGDQALLAAWRDGSVHVGSGAYFGGLDLGAATLERWPTPAESSWWSTAEQEGWQFRVGVDWGTASPFACIFLAEAPGDSLGPDSRPYSANTLIAFDEIDSARPEDPTRGQGWTGYEAGGRVRDRCEAWGIPAEGACDPSMRAAAGHGTTIVHEFRAAGVYLTGASRIPRPEAWQLIRGRLAAASTGDRPALFITRSCRRLLETMATIRRSPFRPEDLDTTGLDHWLDAARYGVLGSGGRGAWGGSLHDEGIAL